MEGRHPPVIALCRSLLGGGDRRTEHDRVCSAGDRLGDVATGAHPTVGDHVDVPSALLEIPDPCSRRIGDGRGLGNADSEHAARSTGSTWPHSDEHPHGTGAHQVQRPRVRGATADDDRHLGIGDELEEVERIAGGRHMLG